MSMDWGELGKQIAGTGAKLLGEAIPIPGAGVVADMAAEALGTDKDPDAMAEALKKDPQAAAKLKEVEAKHKEEMRRLALQAQSKALEEETKRLSEINQTMRAGYDNNVYWRRGWGWISAVAFGVLVGGVCVLAYLGVVRGNTEALQMIPQLVTAAATLFAIPMAVLGVAEYQGGKERRALAGDRGNGGVAKAIKALRG
jgi:hypothetical protein